jgi:hypothetical protein
MDSEEQSDDSDLHGEDDAKNLRQEAPGSKILAWSLPKIPCIFDPEGSSIAVFISGLKRVLSLFQLDRFIYSSLF